MSDIMKPVINLNGTTRAALVEQRVEARHVLRSMMKALRETAPHGRDYFDAEHYKKDLEIFQNRRKALDELYIDLGFEAMAIQEGGEA